MYSVGVGGAEEEGGWWVGGGGGESWGRRERDCGVEAELAVRVVVGGEEGRVWWGLGGGNGGGEGGVFGLSFRRFRGANSSGNTSKMDVGVVSSRWCTAVKLTVIRGLALFPDYHAL